MNKRNYCINLIILVVFVMLLSSVKNVVAYFTDRDEMTLLFNVNTSYTISYNNNTGIGTMQSQEVLYGDLVTLNNNSFTKPGYLFGGWNSAPDGSGTSFNDGDTVSDLNNITLYAQWKQQLKYAVQIYGIRQDEDNNGNTLGLSFGPAVGGNYNNTYITHEYEETANGSEIYYVKIITHTVDGNGTETLSSEYLLDSNSNNVTRTLAEKNKYDVNIHNMTWTQISEEPDKTVFTDCMLCGDTKSVELNLNSEIASGTTFLQYGDGAGMIYCIVKQESGNYFRVWNPSISQNSAVGIGLNLSSNEETYGSNAKNAGGYKTSHIRATLIGADISNPDVAYAGDNNLSSYTCIFSCIQSELKNIITPKKIRYVTGTYYTSGNYSYNDDISDTIWLLSNRELYGFANDNGRTTEGVGLSGNGYDKFGNAESNYFMSAYNEDATSKRTVYDELNRTYPWWLRSVSLYGIGSYIVKDGALKSNAVNDTYGLSFGFCLSPEQTVTFNANNGTGTMENQIILCNTQTALNTNTFTREGYAFAGWNTEPDGSGENYTDEQLVTNIGNITLYAKWEANVNTQGRYAIFVYGINNDNDKMKNDTDFETKSDNCIVFNPNGEMIKRTYTNRR